MSNLSLRRVKAEDSKFLHAWRNNPRVYQYALNPHPVALSDHEQWFERVLKSSTCFFYMGLIEEERIGTVRYDLLKDSRNEAEVSISIAPEFWGKGLAFRLMKMAENVLKNESEVTVIHATVLSENTSSLGLFTKSDFKPVMTKFKKSI